MKHTKSVTTSTSSEADLKGYKSEKVSEAPDAKQFLRAQALKENLLRRKQQKRAKQDTPDL